MSSKRKVTQKNVLSAFAMSIVSAGRGMSLAPKRRAAPTKMLRLYELEGCPFSRLVRERLCELQLDVEIYPCPKGGTVHRSVVNELRGKKTTLPVLHDRDRDVVMSESADIVRYLNEHYGPGTPQPPKFASKQLSALAASIRPGQGLHAEPSIQPKKLMTLYSFEPSPFCRLVRERMTELELPYIVKQLPRNSWRDAGPVTMRLGGKDWVPTPGSRRAEMVDTYGRAQVPFLIDPNTSTELFESSKIVRYLEETYRA